MKRIKTAKNPLELLQNLRGKFNTNKMYKDNREMCGYWLINSMIDHILDIHDGSASSEWKRIYLDIQGV